MEERLTKLKPRIFGNYIDNNSNVLRRNTQAALVENMEWQKNYEEALAERIRTQTTSNFEYLNYDPQALKILRPTQSINKLIRQT